MDLVQLQAFSIRIGNNKAANERNPGRPKRTNRSGGETDEDTDLVEVGAARESRASPRFFETLKSTRRHGWLAVHGGAKAHEGRRRGSTRPRLMGDTSRRERSGEDRLAGPG
jgi:hypothetical protein